MSDPINPSKDPSYPLVPPPRSSPVQPKNPGKFKEILEQKEEIGTEDFLGIKLTPKEKEMVWSTILQQMSAQIKMEQDNMMEELKRQQRQIENPDE
ncbi:MAG: hypothetical protein ACRCSV_03260 [Chlamydiales bacterium]